MKNRKRPLTILMADDDQDDCLLVTNAFGESEFPCELRIVNDGMELMDYLHQRGMYSDAALSPRPAFILLDLNMPKKDGREALIEIKADADLKTIPIVILTTSKEPSDIAFCYGAGAAAFIVKPHSFDGLVEVVDLLGKYWFRMVELPNEH